MYKQSSSIPTYYTCDYKEVSELRYFNFYEHLGYKYFLGSSNKPICSKLHARIRRVPV